MIAEIIYLSMLAQGLTKQIEEQLREARLIEAELSPQVHEPDEEDVE